MIAFVFAAVLQISTFAGTGSAGHSGDGGPATKAQFREPYDIAIHDDGTVFVCDTLNHCVRRIDPKTGIVTAFAGCGRKGFSGDGGKATDATFNEPCSVVFHEDRVLIVDRLNACVRMVHSQGIITTIAGTGGKPGFAGEGGPADQAQLREPHSAAIESGNLYIADVKNCRVRMVGIGGRNIIGTFCGNGRREHSGDGGDKTLAGLFGPRAVAFNHAVDLYICEREGNCIRSVDDTGINRYAGTGAKGFKNGPALKATFNGPKDIEFDKNDHLFVADTENHAIRRIDAKTREVTTFAGGRVGFGGDGGPPEKAQLSRPHGIAIAKDGTLYIADSANHRIRLVK